MTRLCVIDGDLVSYRCAAANEKRLVVAQHKETLEELEFDTATKFKEWVGDDIESYTTTPKQLAEPIENALSSIKRMVASLVESTKCDSYHVVLSGKDNFRLDLPLPTRYKDSRKDTARPLQLNECREYLLRVHNAEVSEGVEADDVLVGYAYQGYKNKEYVVQASIDKDAKHGPGWLFDWTLMEEPELIEGYGALELILKETGKKKADGSDVVTKSVKGKGRAFLWYQILFGDPADSYKPCELAKVKFGEIGAYDILKHAKTDKEALEAIVTKYKLWYPEPVTYRDWNNVLHTKDWLEIMQMYADCAFMRRWEGDRLDVKALLTKLKIEH